MPVQRKITVNTANNKVVQQFTATGNDKRIVANEISKYVRKQPYDSSSVTIVKQK